MDYVLHIAILIGIFAILASSLDLLAGHTGLIALSHAAFFGIGAYCAALLYIHFGSPFVVNMMASGALAAGLSLMVSLPSLRLHDDYFVIAAFGFQMIGFSMFNNLTNVTRGPLGLAGIPHPKILGWLVDSNVEFLLLVFIVASAALTVVGRIATAPFGRVLHSIREDEVFTRALGKNTVRFKVTVFAVSCGLAGVAGCLYAHFFSYIDPTSFTVMESVLILAMVIIGGAGGTWGPLLGAILLTTLPELLRYAGVTSAAAANLRGILYGGLLIAMMMLRPRGLVGRYRFGR